MTQDTYRFAYEEANSELREISGQFEQLLVRKERVEQVIEALRPLLGDVPAVETSVNLQASEAAPFLVDTQQIVADPTPEVMPESVSEPVYAEQSSDPFQRRIDNALRHGFGSKDSRVLPRALNGLLSRA
jgi:seryl-tRNA synthetase